MSAKRAKSMKKGKTKTWVLYERDAFYRWVLRKISGRLLLINLTLIFFISSLLVFLVERGRNPLIHHYGDAVWMMVVTMATVGYGDVVPITVAGRVFTVLAMVLGIGALSVYISTRATRKFQDQRKKVRGLDKLARFSDHIVVCGWNGRGSYVMSRLREELKDTKIPLVLLCDLEDKPVDDDDIYFFRGSPVNEADLKRVQIGDARAIVLLADESKGGSEGDIDARTVLAALATRSLNSDIKMTAEVLEPGNKHHLELAGAGEILDSNMMLGNMIARSALHHGLINTISALVTRESKEQMASIPVSKEMEGMSQEEAAIYLKEKFNAKLLMVTSGERARPIDPAYRLAGTDRLLVLSEKDLSASEAP
jgi:voltage-gated potassium channel